MTQAEALSILKTGANVFLTGEPGSGKTHTVNAYTAYLREHGIEPSITASTGIAATHIGGMTIHSWCGIGIRKVLSSYDLDAIANNKRIFKRLNAAQVLIIDEVSMLSPNILSLVESVCKETRRNEASFGGLQVLFVGDFFQLPPVVPSGESVQQSFAMDELPSIDRTSNERREDRTAMGQGVMTTFAFTSPAWKNANPLVCYLSEQHRQEDPAFLEFLTAMRQGTLSQEHQLLIQKRLHGQKPADGITQLYSHNADVDRINDAQLAKLPGTANLFEMQEHGPELLVAALKRGCLSPETLSLKVGARVMFTKNDTTEHSFANGTLGIVKGFTKESGFPLVTTLDERVIEAEPMEWSMEDNGVVLARISQVPLRLAWAMTVHKSQGMSLDAAHMDLSLAFEYGQGYVALSRVRTLAGLSLGGLNKRALEVHPAIQEKDAEFRALSEAAEEGFLSLPEEELAAMHKNFILACGGVVQPQQGDAKRSKKKAVSTYETTRDFLTRKEPLDIIAKERGLTMGTIVSHMEKLVEDGALVPERDLAYLQGDARRHANILKAFENVFAQTGEIRLTPVRELLGDTFSFEELRIVRLFLNKKE